MRRALALALAAAALGGCNLLTGDFALSGTVDVAPRLRDRLPTGNVMLFVVAESEGGVPVAVRRIVNPEFPAEFSLESDDLLVPALRRGERVKVHAEMNASGDAGHPKPGDLEGAAASESESGDSGIRIVLDRVH
ncbi:MAG TPA: hypothetical protein VH309_11515 [Elusimicrobiota bacterium]|jgi:hypothetical protein|nr:hypothetical protein [Elusimicrobiota bacterium]